MINVHNDSKSITYNQWRKVNGNDKLINYVKFNAWKKSIVMVKVNIGESVVNNIEIIKVNK